MYFNSEEDDLVSQQLRLINDYLQNALDYELGAEVILWALRAMKKNPELSVEDAMCVGFHEWVK